MSAAHQSLRLLGAPGSPYTRKMIALLRYRRIAHAVLWGGHQAAPPGLPAPKVKLLPTVYFPGADGGVEAVVDSTPIIRRLERMHEGRSVLPDDPALAFLNDLIEDYADEWLTKAMFHYRWAHKADRDNAGPLLIFWSVPMLPDSDAGAFAAAITKRQFERLYVVGSNDVTAETIEQSYTRFLALFDALLQHKGYVLGARPASADFAIYGQLTQLGIVEPTSAALTARHPRVRAWIDRMEDLSGNEPQPSDWMTRDEALRFCAPLLDEIARVYAPFLLANATAVLSGAPEFAAEIDGRPWKQPTFPYQARCLQWLREGYAALSEADRAALAPAVRGDLEQALRG
jgi:glutathione S-transferase